MKRSGSEGRYRRPVKRAAEIYPEKFMEILENKKFTDFFRYAVIDGKRVLKAEKNCLK